MKIRKAKPSDAMKILRLFNSSKSLFGANYDVERYSLEDIKDYLIGKEHILVVCEKEGKIIGAFFAELFKDYIYLDSFIVDKRYRMTGVGRLMLEYLEKIARKNKEDLIELITGTRNKKMQKLLRNLNYKRGNKFYFYIKEIK